MVVLLKLNEKRKESMISKASKSFGYTNNKSGKWGRKRNEEEERVCAATWVPDGSGRCKEKGTVSGMKSREE